MGKRSVCVCVWSCSIVFHVEQHDKLKMDLPSILPLCRSERPLRRSFHFLFILLKVEKMEQQNFYLEDILGFSSYF